MDMVKGRATDAQLLFAHTWWGFGYYKSRPTKGFANKNPSAYTAR